MSVKSKKTAYADSVIHKSEATSAGTWSEWLDSDLNAEPWDHPKGGEFTDSRQVELPPSLQPVKWKRFEKLKSVTTPTIFEPIFTYPDLITNNKHLLHSEFMRCFVSTLINVQYCGRNGLEIENPSTNFSWNLADQCWQGWFHVYSLNKAGKGAPHRPVFNPRGRYVVRLFLMGKWRRILIDDLIPVDNRGRPLLPRTANSDELWPLLLAKAMLKIAALSWTPEREIVGCSLITSLTGWISLSLNVSHLSPKDQWDFLTKYAKHFEWSREETPKVVARKSSELGKRAKRKSAAIVKKKLQVPEDSQPVLLFLSLEDMRDVDAEEIPGITPCWNHQIYVELSRDVPLDPAQVKAPLAKWKVHRWLDWAIKRGIIDPSEYFVPIRHLLIVSPLRECKIDLDYAYNGSDEEDWEEDSSRTTLASKAPAVKTSNTAESSKEKRGDLPDISLWGDFNKLALYLREVHLFYRQKCFNYSMEVSDSAQMITWSEPRKRKSDTSTRDGKKSGKSMTPRGSTQPKSYEYEDKFFQSRNEALYLLVDSTENKFFLINLSTLPKDASRDSQSRRKSSLIIERHDWFERNTENGFEAELTTNGAKSTVFQLEPGRHLLRIFISSDFPYHVTILSDTKFEIGNRLKMHDLMTAESDRVKVASRRISDGVKKAFESFGSERFADDLKLYYQSYKPDPSKSTEKSRTKSLKALHCCFIEEIAKLSEKLVPAEEVSTVKRALRIFFLDPSIGRQAKQSQPFQRNEILANAEGFDENRAATIVQSFFRMILIKRFRKIHDTRDKEHNRVKETLLRVVEIFERESTAEMLLRAVVKRNNIYTEFYACAKDFNKVLEIQELRGRISNVPPDQWLPIVRIAINAPKCKTVLAALDLFTNLPNYTLRVFANDTKREMLRAANNVVPAIYRHREAGYTIFAYGRSDVQRFRNLEWSLHLTMIKGEATFNWLENAQPIPLKSEISPLVLDEIANNYVPNNRNCISKLLARITNDCLLTLRLKTSYERVLTTLRVVNEAGSIVAEIEGGSAVILPLVFLQHVRGEEKVVTREPEDKIRRSKRSLTGRSVGSLSHRSSNVSKRNSNDVSQIIENSTRYSIEAFVRDDSWPLTEAEWSVVAEIKSKSVSNNNTRLRRSSTLGRVSKIDRPKQSSRKPSQETLNHPYWILQIVTDAGSELEVFQDRSRDEKISELKRLWKTEETGRNKRGSELRERFLEDNCLVIAPSAIDIADRSFGEETESVGEFYDEISSEVKRTLEPPADLGNYLPKLDLSIYIEKEDEEEQSWVKSEYDEETLRNQRAINVLDFEQLQSAFVEEAGVLMKNRRDKYRRLLDKCSENSGKRTRDIEEAYELRRSYVETTKNGGKSVKSRDSKKK